MNIFKSIWNYVKKGYDKHKPAIIFFLFFLPILFFIRDVMIRRHLREFDSRAKIAEATALGSGTTGGRPSSDYIKFSFPYKGRVISTGASVNADYANRSGHIVFNHILAFKYKKITVAFDSLYPEDAIAIVTKSDYAKYGLIQPDSLKWVENPQ